MKNSEAAKILQGRDEKRMKQLFGPKFAQALIVAIAALKNPLLDHRKHGAKGGKVRSKRFSAKDFKRWGQMGGRPPKKKAEKPDGRNDKN